MYDNICVLGNGALAKSCTRLLSDKGEKVILYDTNEEASWYLKRQAEKTENAEYRFFDKKGTFADIGSLEGSILLISAANPYIIPRRIVEDPRVTAVNLHHALLPSHPGRNAEAWTIFEGDEYGGVTWHFITSDVDGGDIISQGKVRLSEDITSWQLLKIQNDLAVEAFAGFMDKLLEGSLSGTKQENRGDKLHYSYEIPGGGLLDPDWPAAKISAFLRAMDYGPAKTLGDPRILSCGKEKIITGYRINRPESGGDMVIDKDGMVIGLSLGKELGEE
ncbi:MAG: hypothetical protein IKI75_05080 [Lachnospiraceae bacterium]|nr:hypothetical protein [Lachnospiraceae bacterium]